MSATGAVDMPRFVAAAVVLGCACGRVRGIHLKDMLVDVVTVRMMQVAVVQVIRVAVMFDGSMTATSAVLMVVAGMYLALLGIGLRGQGFDSKRWKITKNKTLPRNVTDHGAVADLQFCNEPIRTTAVFAFCPKHFSRCTTARNLGPSAYRV